MLLKAKVHSEIKNNNFIIYSSTFYSKPVWHSFFCRTQMKILWRTLLAKQHWSPLTYCMDTKPDVSQNIFLVHKRVWMARVLINKTKLSFLGGLFLYVHFSDQGQFFFMSQTRYWWDKCWKIIFKMTKIKNGVDVVHWKQETYLLC